MRKKQIRNFSIYAILDTAACKERPLSEVVKGCLKAKVEIIQLRCKGLDTLSFYENALLIKKIIGKKALFIINDRADIARLCNADGLHIGQDDIPLHAARRIIGNGKIIGKSCHSLKQALKAEREGADYVSIGPIFSTPTKPEYKPVGYKLLKRAHSYLKIPIVAIGGINKENTPIIKEANAKIIAVVRAVCQAKDIPTAVLGLRKAAFTPL